MNLSNKPFIKLLCQRFHSLEPITFKTMFGGFGMFQGGVMFSLIFESKFYLRGHGELGILFRNKNLEQFVYKKRGRPVPLNYYHIDDALLENKQLLLQYAKEAIQDAQQSRAQKALLQKQRLKNLPNLNLSSERLLYRVGIKDIEDLEKVGAVNAYLRLKSYSRNISLNVLWALAGALEGCHATTLKHETRMALLDSLKILH